MIIHIPAHSFVQVLLKIGNRCPREEKKIPKWVYLIVYHLTNSVWPAQTLRSMSTVISMEFNTDGGIIKTVLPFIFYSFLSPGTGLLFFFKGHILHAYSFKWDAFHLKLHDSYQLWRNTPILMVRHTCCYYENLYTTIWWTITNNSISFIKVFQKHFSVVITGEKKRWIYSADRLRNSRRNGLSFVYLVLPSGNTQEQRSFQEDRCELLISSGQGQVLFS